LASSTAHTFSAFLGAWLAISPWILGFAEQRSAALAAWTLGTSVVFFQLLASASRSMRRSNHVLLGPLLMGAPWAFNFAEHRAAATTVVVSGVLVAAFAIWAMLRAMDMSEIEEERQASGTG
jgi:predicted secreted protein